MGGAMLAMVACGAYTDVAAACSRLCSVKQVIEPEAELVAKYEARYQQFRQIYPACKDLFKALK